MYWLHVLFLDRSVRKKSTFKKSLKKVVKKLNFSAIAMTTIAIRQIRYNHWIRSNLINQCELLARRETLENLIFDESLTIRDMENNFLRQTSLY